VPKITTNVESTAEKKKKAVPAPKPVPKKAKKAAPKKPAKLAPKASAPKKKKAQKLVPVAKKKAAPKKPTPKKEAATPMCDEDCGLHAKWKVESHDDPDGDYFFVCNQHLGKVCAKIVQTSKVKYDIIYLKGKA
jgi:hypothetical protein